MEIPPEKYFNTSNGVALKNIEDLREFIRTCRDEDYVHHVTSERNDFANWIEFVFLDKQLAADLRSRITLEDARKLFSPPPVQNPIPNKEEKEVPISEMKTTSPPENPQKKAQETAVQSPVSNNSQSKFREFTDEELEKFVQFTKREKASNNDDSIAEVKAKIEELKFKIGELWRAQKNPIIPDMLVRRLNSKINYYAITKNNEDFMRIHRLMDEIQEEIDFCAQEMVINVSQEIKERLANSSENTDQHTL
jgi:hypothetical protein